MSEGDGKAINFLMTWWLLSAVWLCVSAGFGHWPSVVAASVTFIGIEWMAIGGNK